MEFNSFGFTDPGKIHDHNEDSFLCNNDERLFLVADGMGGQASGETASKLAIHSIEEFIINSRVKEDPEWPIGFKYRNDLSLEENRLLAAVFYSNRRVYEIGERHASMKGMGTTIIGGIIDGEDFIVVNVGDSRLYRIRDEEIKQLTSDHSLVGEKERNGMLTRKEARYHPLKHILTSVLGHLNSIPAVEIFRTGIISKDIYLLCTDGLHSMIDDDKILKTINSIKDGSLYKIGLSLVLEANLAGGLDNITAVLLSFK